MAEWIDLIIRKRSGDVLEADELKGLVDAVQNESITPEQAGALLMAIFLNGLDEQETAVLTRTLMSSGQTIRFENVAYPPVDIADLGGLGNNAALIALPIAASYGVKLPVIAERSIGTEGGLLDKFESIPGFRTDIGQNEFKDLVERTNIALIGQTSELAPAEIRLSQIRTNTGTLGDVSMTLASLLSRKIAEGARALVCEIGCGPAGLIRSIEDARHCAEVLVSVAGELGVKASGFITDRTSPVGHAIGDVLELKEALEVLKGEGPEDLQELAVNLAGSMLIMGQLASDHKQACQLARDAIKNGKAFQKLKDMVAEQGGNTQALDQPEQLPRAQGQREIITQRRGFVKSLDCDSLGQAWLHLGGSRQKRGENTDHRVGLLIHKKVGDEVATGDVLATVFTSEKSRTDDALESVEEAFLISPNPVSKPRLMLEQFGQQI